MDIKSIAKEFQAFILKGNVVDLAVGVVIGGAFGDVVKAIVAGFINPLLSLFGIISGSGAVSFAVILNSLISFVAIALVVFFLIVKPVNALIAMATRKAQDPTAEPPPLPEDVKLLMEIRDLLKQQAGEKPVSGPTVV